LNPKAGRDCGWRRFTTSAAWGRGPYSFNASDYSDNWGFGIRLNIPQLGPLRIDYGIPIHHDNSAAGKGRIQFGVGWQRPFLT
jgi:outer membrane protein assembly factor BamA